MDAKSIGYTIAALRRRQNLTQSQLAERLKVSDKTVSKWENGRGYPSIDSLKAISRCFSVSLDDLLSGEAILTIAETDGKQKAGGCGTWSWVSWTAAWRCCCFCRFSGRRKAAGSAGRRCGRWRRGIGGGCSSV